MRIGAGVRVGAGALVGGGAGPTYRDVPGESVGLAADLLALTSILALYGESIVTADNELRLGGVRGFYTESLASAADLLSITRIQQVRGEALASAPYEFRLRRARPAYGASVATAADLLTQLQRLRSVRGTGIADAPASLAINRIRALRGVSLGTAETYGRIFFALIEASDAFVYWDSIRGAIPTIGDAFHFARSTSAPSSDAAGREFSALPNTPRFPWATVDGARRPVLQLQPARTVGATTYAVDLARFTAAALNPARATAVYIAFLADFDPDIDSGHILYVGKEDSTAPLIRLRYSGGNYLALVNNGSTSSEELSVPIGVETGGYSEILVILSDDLLEMIVAGDGAVIGSDSAEPPALPAHWSAAQLTLNGYSTSPADARYARVKAIKASAFARTGNNRMAEIQDFALNPAGELI